jgi:hypothetical protein
VALEGVDKGGQERCQPFAAEVIAGFPHDPQECDHLGAIDGRPAGTRGRSARALAEEADRGLAMAAGETAELCQQARFLRAVGEEVARTEGCGAFADALGTHDASKAR